MTGKGSGKHFLSWQEFDDMCLDLKTKIESLWYGVDFDYIYGIPRGGLPLAVRLSYLMNKDLITEEAYIWEADGPVLVVDDIADSGRTLMKYDDFKTATLYMKPHSKTIPNLYVKETNDWICFPWEDINKVDEDMEDYAKRF